MRKNSGFAVERQFQWKMNERDSDAALLSEFTQSGREEPFERIVHRHLDFVFATAVRSVGEMHAAEEVSQNVFAALARKGRSIRCESSLVGWLHRATLLEAKRWWRKEKRRRRHEEAAARLQPFMESDDSSLKQLAVLLDEAVLSLAEKDRHAILLRFVEGRTQKEIGVALGFGEDAARKRIEKALGQLSTFFRRCGYTVPGVISVSSVFKATALNAPHGLAARIIKCAIEAQAAAGPAALLCQWFLALSKPQLVSMLLLLALPPFGLQFQSHLSALKEQGRSELGLASLTADIENLRHEEAELERRFSGFGRSINQIRMEVDRRRAMMRVIPANDNPDLYRWTEDSDYVRIPKRMFIHILAYDPEMDRWIGTPEGGRGTGLRTGEG